MPTPFYHLVLAETLLSDPRLDRQCQQFLAAHRPAFLFGNTAPDVQTVSEQARYTTHFFTIPIRDTTSPQDRMFARYSALEKSESLPADQAAFLAGYIGHLLLDQLWIRQIFQPYFAVRVGQTELQHQLFLHNVLRVYLDRKYRTHLPDEIGEVIGQAQPSNWLPFVDDHDLCEWRDFLVDQLVPQGAALTVNVFANRMNRRTEDFEAILRSRQALDTNVFSRISEARLSKFKACALDLSVNLLRDYLSPLG